MRNTVIGFILGTVLVVPLVAQRRPLDATTMQLTSTSASALTVGCALGVSTGCTGGINSGPIIVNAGGVNIVSNVPGDTTMKLYNNAGTLTWNGAPLAVGSSVSGTIGRIAVFTASNALGDSIMAESGADIDVTGSVDVSSAFKVGGVDITVGGTLANFGYIDQANTWSNALGQTFAGGIALSGGTVSTHGIMIPNAVPGSTTTNLYNNGTTLTWATGAAFATVDTGQGANELYDMDQNVLTTSSPTFAALSVLASSPAGTVTLSVQNSSTAASANTARLRIGASGASNTGDAYASFVTADGSGSATSWSIGADTSASSAFVVSESGTLGTSNALSIAKTTLAATFGGTITTTAGASVGSIAVTSALAGGSNSFYLPAANRIGVITNGVLRASFNDNGLALSTAKRVNFDGADGLGDTYIYESSANTLAHVVGGATMLSMTATAATFGGTVTAPTFIGALTGNASTATILATARNIGGVPFNGSANIVPTTIVVADTTDTTSFCGLWESATGDLLPKTDAGCTYNASTGVLTATGFAGPLTGNVTGNITGTAPAGSLTGTTLNATVVTSSLTTIGTLVAGAVPASLVTSGTFGAGAYIFPSTVRFNGNPLNAGGNIMDSQGTPSCTTNCTSVTGRDYAFYLDPDWASGNPVVTFGGTWTNAPVCVVTGANNALLDERYSVTTTTTTITVTTIDASPSDLMVLCRGY